MSAERMPGTVGVAAVRFGADGARGVPGELVDESSLFVEVAGVGRYALMWTPTEPEDAPAGFVADDGWLGDGEPSAALSLAAGFAFGEGLFQRMADVESIARCPEAPDVVRLVLAPRAQARAKVRAARGVRAVHSSCGACGGEAFEHLLSDTPVVTASTTLSLAALDRLASTMQDRQALWRATGASHAALLFSPEGRVVTLAEDLGRHNALDKAIGRCLLLGHPLSGCGVMLTSRLSFEMVAKSARAGLAIVAGVSAATSLAVRTARDCGITLCGFVRDGSATVYTHPRRMILDATGSAGALPEPAAVA